MCNREESSKSKRKFFPDPHGALAWIVVSPLIEIVLEFLKRPVDVCELRENRCNRLALVASSATAIPALAPEPFGPWF